jgi:hypothetical protein
VVPKIRSNATVQLAAKRLFDIDGRHMAPMDVCAGYLLGGVGVERLPVAIVVMIGVPVETVRVTLEELAQLQVLTAAFRPVIVMDTPELNAARAYGYPTELLIDEANWSTTTQLWTDYIRDKLASIFTTYRSAASIVVGPTGLSRTDQLVLGSLRPTT